MMPPPLSPCARCGQPYSMHPDLVAFVFINETQRSKSSGQFSAHPFELNKQWELDAELRDWRKKHIG